VQELNGATVAANLVTGLAWDEIFSRTDSAGSRYFMSDALRSTLALTNSTGGIQTQYTYEPFGNTTVFGASSGNSYQYTGRENDGTSLYYYRARYFESGTQRFVSEDPFGFNGSMNLYVYGLNSPTNLSDPSGERVLLRPDGRIQITGLYPIGASPGPLVPQGDITVTNRYTVPGDFQECMPGPFELVWQPIEWILELIEVIDSGTIEFIYIPCGDPYRGCGT
jgi:RHS repeat-associated protein